MLNFTKMHGLGNDFVIIDCRDGRPVLTAQQVRYVADRRYGVGCDQLVHLCRPEHKDTDVYLDMYNCDGAPVGACGNATRSVAGLLMREQGRDSVVIETSSGLLPCHAVGGDTTHIAADMGAPKTDWTAIPLAQPLDTGAIDLGRDDLGAGTGVNVGNPHVVFFVNEVEEVDIEELGTSLNRHALFSEGVNVEVASRCDDTTLRMRVYERGAGITQACGTGACATLVAAVRREMITRQAWIVLDGGTLNIEWRSADDHLFMTGAVEYVFDGVFHKL
jgi:diaminopimelate epimerase